MLRFVVHNAQYLRKNFQHLICKLIEQNCLAQHVVLQYSVRNAKISYGLCEGETAAVQKPEFKQIHAINN